MLAEVFGQGRQQLGMGGRIGGAEIVHRIDDAAREEIAPDAIDRGFGEVGMRGHPARQLLARIAAGRQVERRVVEQRRFDHGLGARVQQRHAGVHVLGAEVHVGGMVHHHLAHAEHPGKEGRHAPELVLAPVFVGVVVALRAIEAASHEDADLFGHGFVRRSDLVVGQEMARRRLVALDGDALARDLVVGAVVFDIGANPLPVFRHPLGRQAVAEDGDAEEVGEAEGPVVDELGRCDQRIDDLLALLRIAAGQEFADALRAGEARR